MPALIVNHPSFVPHLVPYMSIEPVTEESIAEAKASQDFGRLCFAAAVYASWDDVVFATASNQVREHYLAAAQAGRDRAARKELSL